ncbi:MAG: hypothetical protein QW244_03415 [Candidatus Pacearchaeota archaeon]
MGNLEKQIRDIIEMDELKRKLIANLQGYLRERQDFIASIPTMDPIWSAPFSIIEDLIEPIIGSIKVKENGDEIPRVPNLFLLFDNIIRSEDLRAGSIQFNIKIFSNQKYCTEYKYYFRRKRYYEVSCKKPNKQNASNEYEAVDFKAAIYLATSGLQAFYSIIENILRNSARHSDKDEIQKVKNFSKGLIENNNFEYNGNGEIKVNENKIKPLIITIEFHYDWNDENSQYKDDFIKVKIYDNLSGWINHENNWVRKNESGDIILSLRKIKEYIPCIEEKLTPASQKGRIIDETGQVIPGSWGMKEMRICASFLRGIKVEKYEEIPENDPLIITPFIYSNDNKNGSLGFEFYLPKVKDLLIVSEKVANNSTVNKENLKKVGVYIESDINKILDLSSRGKFTHEFLIIDIDEDKNIDFIKKYHLQLPYKVFYLTEENNNNKLKIIEEIDTKVKEKIIYKNDLVNMLKNEPYIKILQKSNLLINGNHLPNIVIFPSKLKNYSKLRLSQQVRDTGNFETDNLYAYDTIDNNVKINSNICLVHRYGIKESVFDGIITKKPLCLIPYARDLPSFEKKCYEKLQSGIFKNATENKDFGNDTYRYLYNLQEAGLLNVIVIDERAFELCPQKVSICGVDVTFAVNWFLQNVLIFNLELNSKKELILKGYKVDPTQGLTQNLQNMEINLSHQQNNIQFLFPEHFKNKVHFLIIHQSIISPKIEERFNEFINTLPLEYKPWYIVVTSGRGHPSKEEMPKGSKFLDFSSLRSVLITRPSKYLLTKILTGLKEV